MRSEILNALQDELSYSAKYHEFEVDWREQNGGLWTVDVDVSRSEARLDESLEGAEAWWPAEPRNGAADVLCVIPEEQQIVLRFASTTPPSKGGLIRLYPPRYLEALINVWEFYEHAERSSEWYDSDLEVDAFDAECIPPLGRICERLRQNQVKAFDLFGRRCGFLWGPPGTGKTYTLGVMLAQFLVRFPSSKVLLMSTTNSATDQVLVAVDKALAELTSSDPIAGEMRKSCKRLGLHFRAENYEGRVHLLPFSNYILLQELTQLQANQPPKSDHLAYARWKAEEEELRARIRQESVAVLDTASLVAMTTTRAAYAFEELHERSPFDLVVIDEASQVSLVHAITMAPLAERIIFAGDPKQLAPIVQSKQSATQDWLGNSIFVRMQKTHASTCMLTEQSRMAPDICQLVSTCFYEKNLIVAPREAADRHWLAKRQLCDISGLETRAVSIRSIEDAGTFSKKYGGPIRYESAEAIRDIVRALLRHINAKDLLVLTPFRAQRTLARSLLERIGISKVKVRTVHSSQGTECHTVIFDPVDGSSAFLRTEAARRLVNVALSRAQARLILLLSDDDRRNPLFAEVAGTIELVINAPKRDRSLKALRRLPGFPQSTLGNIVEHDGTVYKVVSVMPDGGGYKLELRCTVTGKKRTASFPREK